MHLNGGEGKEEKKNLKKIYAALERLFFSCSLSASSQRQLLSMQLLQRLQRSLQHDDGSATQRLDARPFYAVQGWWALLLLLLPLFAVLFYFA